MKQIKKMLSFFLGLILIAGILYGFWSLLAFVWSAFSELPKEYIPAIVTAVTTFLVAVITITLGKYLERRLTIEKEMREKKIPLQMNLLIILRLKKSCRKIRMLIFLLRMV